jgi:hypothetical protein
MYCPGVLPPPSSAALLEATRKLMRSLIVQHGIIEEWDSSPGGHKAHMHLPQLLD